MVSLSNHRHEIFILRQAQDEVGGKAQYKAPSLREAKRRSNPEFKMQTMMQELAFWIATHPLFCFTPAGLGARNDAKTTTTSGIKQ